MKTQKPNKPVVKLLMVDDHQLVRDGLKIMLQSLGKYYQFSITEAENGEEAIQKINRSGFDMLIMDYQLPDLTGPETVERILRFKPETKILVLSNYDERPYVQRMMDAGARGYILKNVEPAEMLNAIRAVLGGKEYYCSEVAVKLISVAPAPKAGADEEIRNSLSKRELEVLKFVGMEMTSRAIAKKLSVTKKTIDSHRYNLNNKLHVNAAGLVKIAVRLGLV